MEVVVVRAWGLVSRAWEIDKVRLGVRGAAAFGT